MSLEVPLIEQLVQRHVMSVLFIWITATVLYPIYNNREIIWIHDSHELISYSKYYELAVEADEELIFANVLFRHGDRNPFGFYKNDPWKDVSHWIEGPGQLTDRGKQRAFELGKLLRRRYRRLLNNRSHSEDLMYVLSSDVQRTIYSARAVVNGFFGSESWTDEIDDISIHTIPNHLDHLIYWGGGSCTRYNYKHAEQFETSEYKNRLKKYKDLYKYLEKHTGSTVDGFHSVASIYDTLRIEKGRNFTLPEWTKEVFYPGSDMEVAAAFAFLYYAETKELCRLRYGFLLRDMLDHFTEKSQSKLSPDYSFWMYSVHDSTIFGLLYTFGVVDIEHPPNPPFAATILFELYKSNDDYYVQLFYRSSDDEILYPLNMPKCGTKCPLKKFFKVYEEVIPTGDYETECLYTEYE